MQSKHLMKVVEASMKKEAPPPKELSVTPMPLSEDNMESYLVMFQSIMEAHKMEEKRWTQFLASNLYGKAQQSCVAFSR